MTEEKFLKEKTPEEALKEAIEFLDTAKFNFACFVEAFKRYIEKLNIIKLEDKIEKLEKRAKDIKEK